MSTSSKGRAWIVGVEDIRPRFTSTTDIVGDFIWHTDSTRRLHAKPHRTRRYGADEMDMYVRFVQDLEEIGYEIVPEEDAPAEAEA